MRLLRTLFWVAVLGGLGFAAILFLIQNVHTERLVFFGMVRDTNFAVALAGAAAFGFLIALLLIVPGRIAAAFYSRSLDRELRQLEDQVAVLSEQRERLLEGRERVLLRYERLFAEHNRVVGERDQLRAHLAAVSAAAATAAAAAATANSAASREVAPGAAPARRPLSLRERGTEGEVGPSQQRGTGSEVRAAAATSTSVATATPRPSGTPATSRRVLPPVAPAPPMAHPPARAAVSPEAPTPLPGLQDYPPPASVALGTLAAERVSAMRHHVAASLGEWRTRGVRMRRSAGTRYNDMRMSLAPALRSILSVQQQDSPQDTTNTSSAAPAQEDGGSEIAALKGEHTP